MAVKFWLGAERSDKSHKMLEFIIDEAKKYPDRQFLIVAPDQAGLATQRELVLASSNKGILNIDVLSFLRLAHRIGDEVGSYDNTVTTLDDTGKNLLLSLIANRKKEELTVFGGNIDKLGYIAQIKSVISEFMQYGVGTDKVDEMAANAAKQGKGLLASKLTDINIIYKAFLEYIRDKYTTTEEILARLKSIVPYSETLRNSVVVFDGFTGFTHVQLELIACLMEYVRDIHIALLLEDDNQTDGSFSDSPDTDSSASTVQSHELFYLSKSTINKIEKLADERRVPVREPYVSKNILNRPELKIFSGQNPNDEVRMTASLIKQMVQNNGYRYSDIAIVSGDLEGYRRRIERIFPKYGISYFVDRTEAMLLNPFVEYVRSIIEVFADNYSYEAVFRYLKSGMTDFTEEEIDRLDNYCLAAGIKGSKKWHSRFDKPTRDEKGEAVLEIEDLRRRVVEKLDAFSRDVDLDGQKMDDQHNKQTEGDYRIITASSKASVRTFCIAIYQIIDREGIENKLRIMSDDFSAAGDFGRGAEYKQIYVRIMNVLEKLVDLIPEERVSVKQFRDLLGAGLDSIRIGVAPKSRDYVQVGDLTRSRVGKVKALFIIGANDGVIPSPAAGGGIINDNEKELLLHWDENLSLAPTAKEDAYTQRLYLYMAMNRPKEQLYLSYARVNSAGKTQMPSYIIRQSMKENNDYHIINAMDIAGLYTREEAYSELIRLLYKVNDRSLCDDEDVRLKELLEYFMSKEEYSDRVNRLIWHNLIRPSLHSENNIGKAVASVIYGNSIEGSVTRLETYANCAYQYFIQYGLRLKDRELFDFEARDLGTIFHESLSEFAKIMRDKGCDFFTISEEQCNAFMDSAVETVVRREQMGALYSSARMTYTVNRIRKIMQRTSEVISQQIKKGSFKPKYFEIGFDEMRNLESLNIRLSDDEYMKLTGRIDRIDTLDEDDRVYVKIIDYKSSDKSVDLAAIYEGRQLQLLVYLNAAMEYERVKTGKNTLPAGILYYHIDDPMVEDEEGKDDEKIKQEIFKKLKLSGLVNADENGKIVNCMDFDFEDKSTWSSVVSAHRDKDGNVKEGGSLISGDNFNVLREYINKKIAQMGRNILDGDIGVPVPDGQKRLTGPNCKYCDFKAVCTNRSLDPDEEGEGETGVATKISNEEALELMRSVVDIPLL